MDQLDTQDSGLKAHPGKPGLIYPVGADVDGNNRIEFRYGASEASRDVTHSKDVIYEFLPIESVLKIAHGKGLRILGRGTVASIYHVTHSKDVIYAFVPIESVSKIAQGKRLRVLGRCTVASI